MLPEIPKWVYIVIGVAFCFWLCTKAFSFFGEVNTTINKANSSINVEKAQYQKVID
ncbi:hypothetical protein IJG72_04315 [bacterium]|nr:hypothetical protein [bacterium]